MDIMEFIEYHRYSEYDGIHRLSWCIEYFGIYESNENHWGSWKLWHPWMSWNIMESIDRFGHFGIHRIHGYHGIFGNPWYYRMSLKINAIHVYHGIHWIHGKDHQHNISNPWIRGVEINIMELSEIPQNDFPSERGDCVS